MIFFDAEDKTENQNYSAQMYNNIALHTSHKKTIVVIVYDKQSSVAAHYEK